MLTNKIAVVTGANRGIGKEVARELSEQGVTVIVTARDPVKGKSVAEELVTSYPGVVFHPLDITQHDSIQELEKFIAAQFGRLDILINNAALGGGANSVQTSEEDFRKIVETNFFGAFNLSRALLPYLRKSPSGRIINISSGLGAMNSMGGGYAAYRVSKAALNALTAIMASDLSGTQVHINTMDPGWVKTDMGGAGATRSVEKGAETAVWLALEKEIPSGKFFRDKKIIAW